MMIAKKRVLVCTSLKKKTLFKCLNGGDSFSSGGVLYNKILDQDLKEYGINNVNAVSVMNAGLTFFEPDEEVYEVSKRFMCLPVNLL